MEIKSRTAPNLISTLNRLQASEIGSVVLETLGRLVLAHHYALRNTGQPEAIKFEQILTALENHPQQYQLFVLLRLIECTRRDKPRIGEAKLPRDEVIRIGQKVSLEFATADISGVDAANQFRPVRIMQQVIGLFGANGALPTHLTEYVFEREYHERDASFARFVDVFHHRMVSLFYRAWANCQPVIGLDRPNQDSFGNTVAAICGIGLSNLRERDRVSDLFKLAHSGILSRQIKSAEGLQVMLSNYLQVSVTIEEYVGTWLDIPVSERSYLGSKNGFCHLGEDLVIGSQIWDCQTKFTVVLGPLDYQDYLRFLPIGQAYPKLADIIRLYLGEEFCWDVRLVLKAQHVPQLQLGQNHYLGWSSWMSGRPQAKDADELVLAGCN